MSQDFKNFWNLFGYFLIIGSSWNVLTLSWFWYVPLAWRNISVDHRWSFQGNAYVLNVFDTFFSHISTEFFVFACICCCFHSHKTYCNIFLITHAKKTSFTFYRVMTERIYWLLLKAIALLSLKRLKIIFQIKNFNINQF